MNAPRSTCPNDDIVTALVNGSLFGSELGAVGHHLDECSSCRALVANLVSSDEARPMPVALRPLNPGDRLGRYTVLDVVGEGGMGVVYRARDPELAREVALKVVRTEQLVHWGIGDARHRITQEARTMARLCHPNVVRIYDSGTFDERIFFTMELVRGSPLSTWLKERPRALGDIIEVFVAAGNGLVAAHASGVVHRDFKPANVLIAFDGRVLVTDFGLAIVNGILPDASTRRSGARPRGDDDESTATESGTFAGTPAYMAPESLLGGRATPASDQYSFCVALYEAVFGERPVHPAHPPAATQIPQAICTAIVKGLSLDPAARHSTMADLLRLLSTNVEGQAGSRRSLRGRTRVLATILSLLVAITAGVWSALTEPRLSVLAPNPGPLAPSRRVAVTEGTRSFVQATNVGPQPRRGSAVNATGAGRSATLLVKHEDTSGAPLARSGSVRRAICDPPFAIGPDGIRHYKPECPLE